MAVWCLPTDDADPEALAAVEHDGPPGLLPVPARPHHLDVGVVQVLQRVQQPHYVVVQRVVVRCTDTQADNKKVMLMRLPTLRAERKSQPVLPTTYLA